MRILVAEDHPSLARSIADGLRDEGYAVDLTFDGSEALHLAATNPYDAIVLDIMLPGRDGFSIIQSLRRRDVQVPILCLPRATRSSTGSKGWTWAPTTTS